MTTPTKALDYYRATGSCNVVEGHWPLAASADHVPLTRTTTPREGTHMTAVLQTADVELYDGGTQPIIQGGQVSAYMEFAKTLAVSNLLPLEMRGKPADVFMAVMQGLDLGFRPMQALALIDVIKGKPCVKAEGKRALILAAGHDLRIPEWTDDKCVIEGRRRGDDEWWQASFTREQATQAKLAGDNWAKYPADMLLARATSRLCKAYFADVTNGLATSEDMYEEGRAARPSLAQVAAEREPTEPIKVADEVITPSDEELREAVAEIARDHQGQPTLNEAT